MLICLALCKYFNFLCCFVHTYYQFSRFTCNELKQTLQKYSFHCLSTVLSLKQVQATGFKCMQIFMIQHNVQYDISSLFNRSFTSPTLVSSHCTLVNIKYSYASTFALHLLSFYSLLSRSIQ